MKKVMISWIILTAIFLSLNSIPVLAKETKLEKNNDISSWYAPSTETTINGVSKSQIITPMDVIIGPYFDSYKSNYVIEIDRFKIIGKFKRRNVYGKEVEPMTATVTSSTSQGSEWTGNMKKVYFTNYIYSTIYPSNYLDVFADAYDTTN